MSYFYRRYWQLFIVSAAISSVTLCLLNSFFLAAAVPKPALRILRDNYVAATQDWGQADHSLFYFNMFGFGDRIRSADLILLGSSHTMFGLSANRLTQDLARTPSQRLVTAFNMGLGEGEGITFANLILKRLGAPRSFLILDLFSQTQLSDSARMILRRGPVYGYTHVLNIWAEYLSCWVLYGLAPKIAFEGGALKFQQFLRGVIVFRNWKNGDVYEYWSPRGELYRAPPVGVEHPLLAEPNYETYPPDATELQFLKALDDRLALTLVPYPGFDSRTARAIATDVGAPYLPISPTDLLYWDDHHLTAASSAIASDRLAAALLADPRFLASVSVRR
jgi:hypothetical protein